MTTSNPTPADLANAVHAESAPAQVADAIAPHFAGEIRDVEIAEGMHGWTVTTTVVPSDKRKRVVSFWSQGATRGEAVQAAVDDCVAWAHVHGLIPARPQ